MQEVTQGKVDGAHREATQSAPLGHSTFRGLQRSDGSVQEEPTLVERHGTMPSAQDVEGDSQPVTELQHLGSRERIKRLGDVHDLARQGRLLRMGHVDHGLYLVGDHVGPFAWYPRHRLAKVGGVGLPEPGGPEDYSMCGRPR